MSPTLQTNIAIAVCGASLLLWAINTVMYFVGAYRLSRLQVTNSSVPNAEAEVIRTMIRHENDLVNHRLTWLLALEGFLFAGIGFAWDKLPDNKCDLVFLFSVIGMAAAGSATVVLDAAHYAIMTLGYWWDRHKPKDFLGPDVMGYRGHHWLFGLFVPWRLIPPTLVVVWLLLFLIKSGKL
jgi:hypothetical protein